MGHLTISSNYSIGSSQIKVIPQFDDTVLMPIPEWALGLYGPDDIHIHPSSALAFGLSYVRTGHGSGPLGPFTLKGDIPGYLGISREFFLPQYDGGDVAVIEFDVERGCPGFGSLLVVFRGNPPSERCTSGPSPDQAIVSLTNSNGNKSVYGLGPCLHGEMRLDGIPAASYQVAVHGVASGQKLEPTASSTVVVHPGRVASLEFDVSDTSSLDLKIKRRSGQPYVGPAVILLGNGTTVQMGGSGVTAWQELDFDNGPYRVEGLLAGTYTVVARFPYAKAARSVQVTTADDATISLLMEDK